MKDKKLKQTPISLIVVLVNMHHRKANPEQA
jgi:hypothetical protein